MNIRIVRLDISETNRQLERIADLLEAILASTNPIPAQLSDFPGEEEAMVFYSDDREEIIQTTLNRLGKGHLSTKK